MKDDDEGGDDRHADGQTDKQMNKGRTFVL